MNQCSVLTELKPSVPIANDTSSRLKWNGLSQLGYCFLYWLKQISFLYWPISSQWAANAIRLDDWRLLSLHIVGKANFLPSPDTKGQKRWKWVSTNARPKFFGGLTIKGNTRSLSWAPFNTAYWLGWLTWLTDYCPLRLRLGYWLSWPSTALFNFSDLLTNLLTCWLTWLTNYHPFNYSDLLTCWLT